MTGLMGVWYWCYLAWSEKESYYSGVFCFSVQLENIMYNYVNHPDVYVCQKSFSFPSLLGINCQSITLSHYLSIIFIVSFFTNLAKNFCSIFDITLSL